jgi:hypothetical protein
MDTTAVRTGTAAEWADADSTDFEAGPILEAGEVGIIRDKGELFVGDGVNRPAAIPARLRSVEIVTGVVLVAGAKVTANVRVAAGTIIVPVLRTLGTVTSAKLITVSRSNGVSFTLTSSDGTDTSTYDVLLIQP